MLPVSAQVEAAAPLAKNLQTLLTYIWRGQKNLHKFSRRDLSVAKIAKIMGGFCNIGFFVTFLPKYSFAINNHEKDWRRGCRRPLLSDNIVA